MSLPNLVVRNDLRLCCKFEIISIQLVGRLESDFFDEEQQPSLSFLSNVDFSPFVRLLSDKIGGPGMGGSFPSENKEANEKIEKKGCDTCSRLISLARSYLCS